MLRSPSVWSLWLMYGFLGFSGNFYLTLLPTYLKNHRHLDSDDRELADVVALRLRRGRLLRWAAGSPTRSSGGGGSGGAVGSSARTGLTLAALSIVAVPWVEDVGPLGFLLVLTFFGNDLAMAPAWAAAADIGERYTGVLSGRHEHDGQLHGGHRGARHRPALPGG